MEPLVLCMVRIINLVISSIIYNSNSKGPERTYADDSAMVVYLCIRRRSITARVVLDLNLVVTQLYRSVPRYAFNFPFLLSVFYSSFSFLLKPMFVIVIFIGAHSLAYFKTK
eukprot:SAG31_NODE_580_length_13940_cov_16.175349_8_plen_112_part_00